MRFHQLPVNTGILVISVEPNSPAQRAGLQPGDVILSYNNHSTSGIDDLHKLLTEGLVGIDSPLEVLHGQEKRTLQIEAEESPQQGN